MIKNYLLTAIRNLFKNKFFSFINVLGLSVGIASFILITLYVYHEFTFDQYHTKANRIFRIVENLRTENELLLQSTSSPPMGPTMAKDFPEVESYVRFSGQTLRVKKGDITFYEDETVLADSTLFDVFSFNLLEGDPKKALTKPNAVVLTQSAALKYFGTENPVGKTIDINNQPCEVTGLMEDVPHSSHFRFNIAMSFSNWSQNNKEHEMNAWFWNGFHTYVLLKEGANVENVRAKMAGFIQRNIEKGGMYYEDLPLQPLTSIYLDTPRSWENGKRGNANNLYVLSAIAVFTLLIACFNYVNLATARATRRLKEVGLRKVLGAQRRALIAQFLGESLIMSFTASAFALLLAWLALPTFNVLVDSSLSFSILPETYYIWISIAGLGLFLGLLSGSYPAIMISGFHPLEFFRPSVRGVFGHQSFRKILVSVQFVISICLVAGTMLVYDQLTLMRNIDLGFKKEATLILNFNWDGEVQNHLDAIKNEIKSVKGVTSVATSHTIPGESTTNLFAMIEMKDGKLSATNINTNFVDHDFLPAYGIDIVSGRNFSRAVAADDTTAFILNETAVRDFGMTPEEAIGKKVNQNGKKGVVIGVMKDYHYRSLHHKIEPLMININKYTMRKFSIRISDTDIPLVVNKLEEKWKAITPSLPFTFSFLDDDYDRLYSADAKLGKVAAIFSGLAIFVGCLGLLGLTSFSVERRVKEIGIRKVLGATSGHVVYIISSEFVKLILVAFVIAVPLTYYMIMEWLSKFTHQISVGPITFIIAGISVLVLAWSAVGYLSFKAAGTNPTAVLREG